VFLLGYFQGNSQARFRLGYFLSMGRGTTWSQEEVLAVAYAWEETTCKKMPANQQLAFMEDAFKKHLTSFSRLPAPGESRDVTNPVRQVQQALPAPGATGHPVGIGCKEGNRSCRKG
jgi:hypothetical protein